MSRDSLSSSSTYSTESTEDEHRQVLDRRTQPEVLSRQRSLTLDSATGSSVETVRSPAWNVGDCRVPYVSPEESTQPPIHPPLINKSRNARCPLLSANQQSSAALTRASRLPQFPVRSDQTAYREPGPPINTRCLTSRSMMMSKTAPETDVNDTRRTRPESRPTVSPTASRRKAFSSFRPERKSSVSRPASTDSGHECPSPVEIRPRLVHHSPPPWSIGGLDETWVDGCGDSPISEGQIPRIEPINPNHQSHHFHYQAKLNSKRPGAGLGKLFKSVKASLGTGSTLDLSSSTTADSPDNQGSHQGWLSLNKAKSSSVKSVEVDSRSALAQEESDPLDITMALDQEESNSLSSGSCSTIDSTATSTFHSSSTQDLNGYGKDRLSPLTNSLDACQPHSPSHNRSPTMSTQTAFNQSPPSVNCFGNSFASNSIHGRHDHPKLKLKASFSFLNNFKRAIGGGVDHSLSFSFHNTNSISLPFGTVLRNNGLDPLPHCHPLPFKHSLSSPFSLNYPSSLPPRLEQPAYFVPPTQPLALSSSSPELFDVHLSESTRKSPLPSHPNHLRREEDSLHHLKSQRTTDWDSPHPLKPPSKLPQEPPTLNLRPVSIPFAAGFSEQFLLSNLNSDDSVAETRSLLDQREEQRQGTDHQDHCSCCSSLASENATLKNRVKELELHIYRTQASKSRRAEE